jgi:putative acetyltransferase
VLTIRSETPQDAAGVERVNREAFGREQEGLLVTAVRLSDVYVQDLSLVAERDGAVVGHVLFSRVRLEGSDVERELLALGPVAVAPPCQRQGIGAALIRAGLERATELGYDGVVLIGHPSYYPRFGFRPARDFGLRTTFAVPDEAFMALPLREGGLEDSAGTVVYSPPFHEV